MKNKKRKIIIMLFMFIFMMGIMYSLYNIIIWFIENKNNNEIKEKLEENIEIVIEDDVSKYKIDFDSLLSQNADTVGYLKVNNTNIDYIVVKGKDNNYYLNHNFNQEKNRSGWIFMDYRNNLDGNDKNIVIYGHNRRDGSMFGNLKNILKDQKNNDKKDMKILLVINNKIQEYHVFSAYSIPKEKYYLTTYFNNDKEFQEYIDRAINNSVIDFNQNVSIEDKILTLSTCADNNKDRVVVHAKTTNN